MSIMESMGKKKPLPDLEALGHTIPRGAITVTTPDQFAAIAGHTLTPDRLTKSSK